MRTLILLLLLLATPLLAADLRVHRDLAYAKPKNERHMLDVYAPTEGKDHPVIIWIHGGGWRNGDKRGVQQKPKAFVEKGFIFVSVNYRFVPQVTIKEMTADIAKAIKWVHDRAKDHDGDPDSIFVAGHSAGAHLAALVCTDDRYLKAEGLTLANIKGCFPVDTAAYDVPKQVAGVGGPRSVTYTSVFGSDEKTQKEFSPITHVAKDKHIPAFCLLHVADRPGSTAQSKAFAKALQDVGVDATVVPGEGKNHGTINRDLGVEGDKPTNAVFEFLQRQLNSRTLDSFKVKLDKELTPEKAEKLFGKPDRNVGSGLIIYEYDLADGTKLRLGFPGFAPTEALGTEFNTSRRGGR